MPRTKKPAVKPRRERKWLMVESTPQLLADLDWLCAAFQRRFALKPSRSGMTRMLIQQARQAEEDFFQAGIDNANAKP